MVLLIETGTNRTETEIDSFAFGTGDNRAGVDGGFCLALNRFIQISAFLIAIEYGAGGGVLANAPLPEGWLK